MITKADNLDFNKIELKKTAVGNMSCREQLSAKKLIESRKRFLEKHLKGSPETIAACYESKNHQIIEIKYTNIEQREYYWEERRCYIFHQGSFVQKMMERVGISEYNQIARIGKVTEFGRRMMEIYKSNKVTLDYYSRNMKYLLGYTIDGLTEEKDFAYVSGKLEQKYFLIIN